MKILLAIDGSDASMSAVAATAALSTPPGTTIEIVTVVPDSFAPEGSVWPNVIRVDPPTDRDRVLDDVTRRLQDLADRLGSDERPVQIRVLEGRPATEIVAEARRFGADLIILGARGLSAVQRVLLGSVSSEVVDHAPCPVLIARREATGSIMLAVDGSDGADLATGFVAESGLFREADVHVVSVADHGAAWWAGFSPVDGATAIEVYADEAELAKRRARTAIDAAIERLSDLRVIGIEAVQAGDVVSVILEQAEARDVDVVVVGARSMNTVHRWLVGSVSRAVLHLAPMSVLIVRPRVASEGQERAAEAAVSV